MNDCDTGAAAAYVPFPDWSAWIVHVPAVSNVTDVPDTEHTDDVNDENDTASPDEAVAPTVTGDCSNVTFANAPNEIVCAIAATLNDRETGGAAL